MNEKVVFDQLSEDVADQVRVRQTYKYFNGTDRSKGLYDEAIRMGRMSFKSIKKDIMNHKQWSTLLIKRSITHEKH